MTNKNVILNLIQDLRRLSLRNSVRGRFQIKFGMTSLLNTHAFTLIELLVVVLIIGVLAAIALPQYQKAVTKSRMTKMEAMLSEVIKASDLYYLHNGKYPTSFDNLEIELPLEKLTSPTCGSSSVRHKGIIGGDDFEILLGDNNADTNNLLFAYFTSGKYKCRGLMYFLRNTDNPEAERHMYCAEHYYGRQCGTDCEQGLLCNEVMNKQYKKYLALSRLYD